MDFGAFSPEDLVAAQWADVDVLVTNELRHRVRKHTLISLNNPSSTYYRADERKNLLNKSKSLVECKLS